VCVRWDRRVPPAALLPAPKVRRIGRCRTVPPFTSVETKEHAKKSLELSSVDSHKPLLLVDIDGVISLFGGELGSQAGSFHAIEGIPHFLSSTAAAHLLDLTEHFQPAWCSGWEEKANEHLPHLLGLPADMPFLRFDRSVGRTNAHWKLDAIDVFAGDRPLAWIDDAFNPACHDWADERVAPTLLVATVPERGLTSRERELLLAWARELPPV
jgi:hypothetical protein